MPKSKKLVDKVKWTYRGKTLDDIKDTPENSFAFVYRIALDNGKYYFGKKYIWKPNYTSGKNKGKSKGMYNWQSYEGSSKELKSLIKSGVGFTKEIIKFTFSRAETTYEESKIIFCSDALKDENSLNYWIKCTVYSKNLK